MAVAEVVPGIYRIESELGSRRVCQWVLSGTSGALLVDSGIAGTVTAHVVPALREIGLAPSALTDVVITHADVDHYGGDAELRELAPHARLRAHALDRPLIESWERIANERYGWYRARGLDYDAATWEWLEAAAGPDVPLDGELADGDRIDLGGVVVEVLHLPGHSAGHLGLWEPSTGLAIVSDAVMGDGFEDRAGGRAGPPPYVDVAAYRATIDRLTELRPRLLGTAHFHLMDADEALRFLERSRRFTHDVERAVETARNGAGLPELLQQVATAVGRYPEMEIELARSIGAHLAGATSP